MGTADVVVLDRGTPHRRTLVKANESELDDTPYPYILMTRVLTALKSAEGRTVMKEENVKALRSSGSPRRVQ